MENTLTYYYNLNITNIKNINNNYYFEDPNNKYKLQLCNYNKEYIKNIYEINKKLIKDTLVSEIIPTIQNNLTIPYNNNQYILLKLNININKKLTLQEIENLSNKKNIKKNDTAWPLLWSEKMDYIEKIIQENKNNYTLLNKSIHYYIALAENAIEYYNINSEKISSEKNYYIAHKKITNLNSIEELYDPFNIIFDYKERDIAEYLKLCIFSNYKLSEETYLRIFRQYNIHLIISRLLYPSYYFNEYDEIFLNNTDEKIITKIILKNKEYENFLRYIFNLLKKENININIEWLI